MSSSVKRLVYLALLTALAVVLMFFEFPLLPSAGHLKLDFSFVCILVAALLYGNKDAILVTLIVNGIFYLLKGDLSGLPIGAFANSIALISYLLVFVFWQKKDKLLLGCVVATIAVTVIMFLANYYFITPLYFGILGIPLQEDFFMYCVLTVGLFNLIRWSIISIANYILNSWLTKFVDQIN